MNENQFSSYLEQISEQVLDECKIVTYKSLSKSLGIHVNTAKQLLYAYLTKEKSKFPISATYLLAGKAVDGHINISIVDESDLNQAYSGFVEVTSEHVYSIQKVKNLKDKKVLCGVNKDIPKSKSCDLVIKCSKSVLKLKKEPVKKKESCKTENKKIIEKALVPGKEPEPKVKASPKKISPNGSSEKVNDIKKPTGNITNFFAKNSSKNSDTSVQNEKKIIKKGNEVESRETEKATPEKDFLKQSKKGNKRKRIQIFSDSEESESNEDENNHNNIKKDSLPLPVNLEEEKEEMADLVPRNKRKKRKVIDKTVMNEDGYLETKKEVVFETDSENELEETTVSKETKKPKPEKQSQGSTAPKKQATLFNFFKKN